MASVTIRDLPDETHRALEALADRHGRSTEAEIRHILQSAARLDGAVRLGSLLAEIGREAGGFELTIERDKTPDEPIRFE
ncbi:plasmid stability protein [Cupriavidus respiraculi]|uniref:FitA-like ribbon-helix-helix domain-containing protein n=1 Tax=Cupriavidus respiraculi TaxID=195930 RepID=UPI001C97C870|nr:plasmid stability protein [Cupriavidus respiraculi]MBY4945562.1 plasmid stability protein [Cupriavidus respiraculi]